MVAEARSWYEQDERNVVVVHCKVRRARRRSRSVRRTEADLAVLARRPVKDGASVLLCSLDSDKG